MNVRFCNALPLRESWAKVDGLWYGKLPANQSMKYYKMPIFNSLNSQHKFKRSTRQATK